MWKINLFCNVLILALFWMLAMVAITPAHNLLVRYAETGLPLPTLTDLAIRLRDFSALVPLAWALSSMVLARWLKWQPAGRRHDYVAAHLAASLLLGLVLLFLYALAGILPLLKIGTVLP